MIDLLVVVALLAAYVWLSVLTRRIRALHRRIARQMCRDPEPIVTVRRHRERPISVAELRASEEQ